MKHTDTVFLWVQAMGHGRQDLAFKEAHQGNPCRLFNGTRRCCNDAELRSWIRKEITIRREQADIESLRA